MSYTNAAYIHALKVAIAELEYASKLLESENMTVAEKWEWYRVVRAHNEAFLALRKARSRIGYNACPVE